MKIIDGKVHRFVELIVYGCQMNQSDAERMMGQLRTIGYERTESMEEADLILINTCCVRETAEDRVYGKIGEITHKLYDTLTGIQWGKIPDDMGWTVKVD